MRCFQKEGRLRERERAKESCKKKQGHDFESSQGIKVIKKVQSFLFPFFETEIKRLSE